MLTKKSFAKAADILAKNGWCQFAYSKNGALCAMTALVMADSAFNKPKLQDIFKNGDLEFDNNELRAWVEHNQLIKEFKQYINESVTIEFWNNRPHLTRDAVISVFREFANA